MTKARIGRSQKNASPSHEQSLWRVDDEAFVALFQKEVQRKVCDVVDDEEITRWIRLNCGHATKAHSGRVEDVLADELVDEERAIVFDRRGAQRQPAKTLSRVAVGNTRKTDEETALVRTTSNNLKASIHRVLLVRW